MPRFNNRVSMAIHRPGYFRDRFRGLVHLPLILQSKFYPCYLPEVGTPGDLLYSTNLDQEAIDHAEMWITLPSLVVSSNSRLDNSSAT